MPRGSGVMFKMLLRGRRSLCTSPTGLAWNPFIKSHVTLNSLHSQVEALLIRTTRQSVTWLSEFLVWPLGSFFSDESSNLMKILFALSLFRVKRQRVSCFDSCQLIWISNVIKLMWTLLFSKPAWLRSPCFLDAAVVVGDKSRLRAIPLAMLTMKKETLGFHNFYTWLSSHSPVSIGMGLRSPARRFGDVPP